MIPNLKEELLKPVLCKGRAAESVFEALDELAETIATNHRESNFGPPVKMALAVG